MDKHMTIRVPRRGVKIMLVMAILIAVLAPVAVIAAGGQFTDDDTSVFEADIEWMATTGITFGCNPPANDNYCPTKAVNRGQMAAFMHRLAMNQVVDAATAITADSALDSGRLDGLGPNAYTTVINGANCYGNDCPDVPDITNTEVLEVTITTPVAGVLALNGTADLNMSSPTNEFISSWMTLNGDTSNWTGCEGSFIGVPIGDHKVVGSERLFWLDGNIFHAITAAAPVVSVPAGTHTVRLCAFGSADVDVWSASLSATWTANGSAPAAPTVSPAETELNLAPELIERLEGALNN